MFSLVPLSALTLACTPVRLFAVVVECSPAVHKLLLFVQQDESEGLDEVDMLL